MAKTKVCEQCEEEFIPSMRQRRFCSAECSQESKRERDREWRRSQRSREYLRDKPVRYAIPPLGAGQHLPEELMRTEQESRPRKRRKDGPLDISDALSYKSYVGGRVVTNGEPAPQRTDLQRYRGPSGGAIFGARKDLSPLSIEDAAQQRPTDPKYYQSAHDDQDDEPRTVDFYAHEPAADRYDSLGLPIPRPRPQAHRRSDLPGRW